MVEIKTNDGVVLELASGTKMGLQFDSPFFTDVLGNAEYSLPIKLAGTGNNKIALDFFDRIKSSNRAVSLPNITLKDNGAKVAQDLALYIDSVSGNFNNGNCTFEGQLIGAKDAFLQYLSSNADNNTSKKLRDVALLKTPITKPFLNFEAGCANPNDMDSLVSYWATDIVLNPSLAPHICFPAYYAPNWYLDTTNNIPGSPMSNFTKNGMINGWDTTYNRMFYVPYDSTTAQYNLNPIVPMFKVYWVIQQIMADAGYRIGNAPILSNTDFQKIYVFNTVNENQFNGPHDQQFRVVPANHMPDILINDWLNDMAVLHGFKFYFKPDNTVDILNYNDLLSNTTYDEWTKKADANYVKTGIGADLVGIELNYGNQSSENPLSDELKNLDAILALIDAGAYIAIANVAALSTYSTGTLIYVKSINGWYQAQADGTNLFLSDNLQRLKILSGKTVYSSSTIVQNMITNATWKQLQTDASTSQVTIQNTLVHTGVFYPSGLEVSVDTITNVNLQPFVSAVGIYHGLQNTLGGSNAQPYGSHSNYAPDSTTKLSAWHLGWLGDEGLYNTFWKAWASFIVKIITVKIPMYLTANDLANLDYSKKKRINGVNYFLKSLKVEFPLESGKQTGEFVLAEGIDL
jgi:hypothetical protein